MSAYPPESNKLAAKPSADNRRFARHKVDLRVKVSTSAGASALGRGNDISYSGIALYVALELQIGERVILEFVLPYSRFTFELKGTIRNRTGFRYGLEFDLLRASEQDEIDRICRILNCMGNS